MVTYIVIAVIVVVAAIFLYRKKRSKEMPAGLQVFGKNDDVVFETSTSMTRFIDNRVLWGSGTLRLSDYGCAGSGLFFVTIQDPYYGAGYDNPPSISMSITTTSLTWTNLPKDYTEGVPAKVLIGVY